MLTLHWRITNLNGQCIFDRTSFANTKKTLFFNETLNVVSQREFVDLKNCGGFGNAHGAMLANQFDHLLRDVRHGTKKLRIVDFANDKFVKDFASFAGRTAEGLRA